MAAPQRQVWVVKSEPEVYPWSRLEAEQTVRWDGVRNHQAKLNLRAMKLGDTVLFYHSGTGKALVGQCELVREAYQDPTTEEDWSAVDLRFHATLPQPVTLAMLKKDPRTSALQLVRNARLSVSKVTPAEHAAILALTDAAPAASPTVPKAKSKKKATAKVKPKPKAKRGKGSKA